MGKVARRELALQGLTRLEQFDGMSESTLLAIHGVGPKALASCASISNPAARLSDRERPLPWVT
jgi:hypothetical protein